MLLKLLTPICLLTIAAGALVHGRITQRWELLAPPDERIAKLHDIVIRYSDFESREIPSEMPVKERSRVTCRQYLSAVTKQSIVVSVTTGISGSVATHTPDVCYVGSGYRMTRPVTKATLSLPAGGTATYYVAEFEKKRATGVDRQRVRWAWTADGTWDAPDSPRFRYLRSGELAKVYVVTPAVEGQPEADSPTEQAFTAAAFDQWTQALRAPRTP